MRFKLGLVIGFGLGWLVGKDVLVTFIQGLRSPNAVTPSAPPARSSSATSASAANGAGPNGAGAKPSPAGTPTERTA